MEEISNLTDSQIELKKIDKSILSLENRIDISKDMKSLVNDSRFKKVIIENLLEKEMHASINIMIEVPYMEREREDKLLSEMRSLKKIKSYITETASSLERLESDLRKEKAYRRDVIKNQKGEK